MTKPRKKQTEGTPMFSSLMKIFSRKPQTIRKNTRRPLYVEALEDRFLPAVALEIPAANVNVSKVAGMGNQAEGKITIDPSNPQRLFASSVQFIADQGAVPGLYAAYSTDGGSTWTGRTMASGRPKTSPGGDSLPWGRGDPVAAFDKYGNLFLAYLSHTQLQIGVVDEEDIFLATL